MQISTKEIEGGYSLKGYKREENVIHNKHKLVIKPNYCKDLTEDEITN